MTDANWDSYARINTGERFRTQSATIGSAVTAAIVEEARIVPDLHVLDVACGSGEPAISIAVRLAGSGRVVGADISAAPLEMARQRARQRQLTNVEFQQADVHQLPFADGAFDRVVSRLGVMFFSDLPQALGEIHRVLRAGGRTSHLAWGSMRQPYFESTIGPVLRLLPHLSVPAGAQAMFRFGEQPGTLAKALEKAGFKAVEERAVQVPWNWPGTPEELWTYFQEVTIPLKPLLGAIPPERADIHQAVLSALEARYDGRQVSFDATMVIASGER
jgi:ubiquinone/menaquinone biosynthesis C-methylase UbiE